MQTRTHPRDTLIPTDTALEILRRYRAGYRVCELWTPAGRTPQGFPFSGRWAARGVGWVTARRRRPRAA